MASLTSCMKKAGAALREEDRAAILARFGALTEAGSKADEAARTAVDEQIAEVKALMGQSSSAPAESEAIRQATAETVPAEPVSQEQSEAPAATVVQQAEEANDRDHFTLERMNQQTGQMEPVTFARGEWVRAALIGSNNSSHGEIDGISHARREFSVDGLWHVFGAAYKAERPEPAAKKTVPLSSVVDAVNNRFGAGLGPADAVSIVDAFKGTMNELYDGTASIEDYRKAYQRVRDAVAVKAELGKLKKDDLIRTFGIMARPDEKKDSLIASAYKSMLRAFSLGKEFGPRSYMMTRGGLDNYERQQAEALDAIVEGHTADDLAAYAAEIKVRREERAAQRAAVKESIENPKTLDEYRQFMSFHVRDGKTTNEVRLALLTPEQRAEFDLLLAEESRGRRKATTDDQRTQVRVAGQTVDGEIIATKHTRDGHDLYVVRLVERVSTEDYQTLLAGAKRIGGSYSSFRGNGAVPGFQFRTRDAAEAFQKLAQGDNAAAIEAAKDRRDAFQDDRSQTVSERLIEMADRLEDRADESLGRERKANTARRASFAASAEAAAQGDKAMAKTMRNIASAITSGTAKFLDRVRQKTQVEMLQGFVRTAKDAEIRAKHQSYVDQERHKGERPTGETADYAEFPTFTVYRSDLASLGRQLQEVDGTKKLGDRLMKVADDVSDAFTAWAKEPGNLFRLSAFSVRSGEDVKTAIFKDRETAERAIKRSGLSGKAIVFPEKRGVNRIVMSPSEAIAKGIWQGDGDKRITLEPDFASELVEKMGRANRRGAKVSVPWQFERAYDRRKALARIGIETPAEFRAALREFIGLREAPAAPDKVKELERAMVGRRNDGMDFFPTPESTADEMVAAADIQPGMRVLEPSAGMGHIAERIRAAGFEPDVVEMSGDRRELLEAKGFNVIGSDFIEIDPPVREAGPAVPRDSLVSAQSAARGEALSQMGDALQFYDRGDIEGAADMVERAQRVTEDRAFLDASQGLGDRLRFSIGGYDRIIMNPPFSDGRDIQHVRHAYELLKPGGRLVAIMGESAFTNQNKRATEFREWLDQIGGTEEKLDEGTFNDPSLPVNTSANARMVVIEKPVDATPLLSQTPAQPLTKLAASTTGTDPGKLTDMVANIRAGWADAPPVTVVGTTWDLPANYIASLRRMNAIGKVRALIDPVSGHIYVIADRHESLADAQFSIFHEVLGHYGMRKFLGADYEKTMRQMRAMNAGLAAESRSWMAEYGPGQIEARVKRGMSYAEATVEVDLLSVEEALADRAGKPEQISGFKRLVAKLQAWLREHGLMGAAQWLEGKTQAQVLSLLQSARDAVEKAEGVHAYTEPAAALLSQADQTDTPAFKRWFGKSQVTTMRGDPMPVFHGAPDVRFVQEDGTFKTLNERYGYAGSNEDAKRAFFFSSAKGVMAATYADDRRAFDYQNAEPGVVPAYLSLQNPMIVDAGGAHWREAQKRGKTSDVIAEAKAAGHDGLIIRNVRDEYGSKDAPREGRGESSDVFVAFSSNQIKSATNNSGAFDPASPSILLSQIQQGNIPGTTDTEQEAIARGYKARVKRALKRADGVINGLGELPDTEQYLGQRYRALGKIAAVDKIAGDIRAAFRKASQADKKEIYAYLTTAGANTDAIADPETKTMAAKVKRYIGTVGDQLVARGLISEESREAYRDAYLPRLYLAHLLSDGDWRAIGAGKKVSDMGYLKARKDIPQEIRDVILGEVKDPAFLAATAIAKPMRDMALLDWLAQISEHQEWVQANSLTEWHGKRVSVFWLKAEADALRTRAVHYPDAANREKAMAIANAMDAAAVKALEGADFNRKDYKQIPNTPKYGRLRGIYVRAEIYNDLMGAQEFLPSDPGWAMHLLGYGGLGTKATQLWKMSKVALNIPGQVRNAISNGVMLQLSGVPFHKLPILMGRAISQIRHGGRHWLVAKKYGVTESTFQAQEMFRARRDLLDLERDLKGLTPLVALKTVGAVIADAAGDAYQFTEALFKTVKIMDAMEREGMDEEAAAIEAQKWLFDYSLVDKNVRYLRNAPVGMPFLTYTTKVLPRLAEVALLHPQRFLPWVALMYGMQAWAQAMFGGDDDEWDELKKALPKWMQEKGHVAFLPWRDDAGRLQAVDMSYFFPWSQWAEFGSSLTEGDLKGAGKAMGLFGGPVTSVITAWATGEDSFTGRQIINEGDPTSYQAASLLAYTWDLMMPPMMGSSGVVSPMWLLDPQYGGKLAQASTGATNRMGDQKATYGQAASRIAGFNAYGIDPEVTRTSNLIGMKADIAKTKAAAQSKLSNQGLTPSQREKLLEDYGAELKRRVKEMRKYAEESTVPDFARRQKVTE